MVADLTIQQLQEVLATVHPGEQEYLNAHAPQIARQLIATMQREKALQDELRQCLDDASDERGAAEARGDKKESRYYDDRIKKIEKALKEHPSEYPETGGANK